MKTVRLRNPGSTPPSQVKSALLDFQAALRQHYGAQAPRLLIYGSYARGDAHEASDVDVLLVYPGNISPAGEIHRLGSTLADLNLRYQVLISVLPASQNDLQTPRNAFWKNICQQAVVLV